MIEAILLIALLTVTAFYDKAQRRAERKEEEIERPPLYW